MSVYVHGDNLEQKENHPTKYQDEISKQYLSEIRPMYDAWKDANLALQGPMKLVNENDFAVIEARVSLFNEYKNFLDQQQYAEQFDSRSNLHSSALEEFMYYLFRDLVADYSKYALIGKSHAFKDIFFRCASYNEMITQPHTMVEKKDHDFVIGSTVNASFQCKGMTIIENESFDMPAVAIECKTYLDKTMLEGASTAAEQLKSRNPNAIYYVVAERLKLTEAVNLKKYKVDQIYVLRKQKNTDREYRYLEGYVANPIYADVVWHLFSAVREYLATDWHGMIADGIERGYLI
ncbi:MAG: Bpu10I family restriction endonuclease [Eubacterium sp.]|nr:Bpu10I family restriction endonuclease [Eubacterium sp.]